MNTQPRRAQRRWMRVGLITLALPLLVGSKCVFLFSSGGSGDDDDKDEDREETAVVVQTGRLVADPVAGLRYESGSLSGLTGDGGEFRYEPGGSVRFLLGDIVLGGTPLGDISLGGTPLGGTPLGDISLGGTPLGGTPLGGIPLGGTPPGDSVPGGKLLTPVDLVPGGTPDSPAVINIVRLLKSLDMVHGDDVITLPAAIHDRARLDDPLAGAAVAHLDFAEPVAFVNAASQLVAVLTAGYDHTATLVDAQAARESLRRSLERRGRPTAEDGSFPGQPPGDPGSANAAGNR